MWQPKIPGKPLASDLFGPLRDNSGFSGTPRKALGQYEKRPARVGAGHIGSHRIVLHLVLTEVLRIEAFKDLGPLVLTSFPSLFSLFHDVLEYI